MATHLSSLVVLTPARTNLIDRRRLSLDHGSDSTDNACPNLRFQHSPTSLAYVCSYATAIELMHRFIVSLRAHHSQPTVAFCRIVRSSEEITNLNSPFHSGIASHLSGEAMSLLIEQPESLRNSLAAARRLAVISRWCVSEHTTPRLKTETRRTSIKIPSRSAEFAAALVSSHISYSLPST